MTHPAAAAAEAPGRSPFAGQLVHVLAGLRMAPGARQPAFDEGVWDLTGASDASVQVAPNILHWDFTKIEHEGWRLVARELMIAVLAPGHEQVLTLPLARRDPLAPATCHSKLSAVTAWFQWLSGQGIRSLEQVTQDHCDRYLQQRQGDGLHSSTVMAKVSAIKDLARYGELFTADRYRPGFVPWEGVSAKTVSGYSTRGENKTPPVPDHVMRPALLAGLFLVEVVGPHVAELTDRIGARRAKPLADSRPRDDELRELARRHVAAGQPLPEADGHVVRERLSAGWDRQDPLLKVSFGELGRDLGIRQLRPGDAQAVRDHIEAAVAKVGTAPCWARDAALVKSADDAGPAPWSPPLTSTQADDLAMIVFNACLFVAAAVSGMRSSELMELTTRSCLPPRQSGQGLFRYSLASRRIKGEPLGGAADEWVVIEPAYRAVELATRLSGAKTALAGTEPGTSVFGRYAFTTRFNTFRRWVNSAAGARLGLSPIPEEQVTARMVRRTLALELACRPHGLLAAKVYLKHISIATTEGYAARPGGSQARFHAEMEAEERKQNEKRAVAAFRDFQDGVLPAGPGARSLIAAFQYVDAELASIEARQPTVVATDRHIELLLQKRAATLHVQPANYCWFTDPAKALCLKLAGTPTATSPLAGLCDAARCPQATMHRQHREVWATCAATTATFLGNPRIPPGEKTRLTAEHHRAQQVIQAIDTATGERPPQS
jgi:hypothetical protein